MSADDIIVDEFDSASLEEVKELADVETETQNGRIWKFIKEGKEFFLDQLRIFGISTAGYKLTPRDKSLIEKYAAGAYTHWKRPEHTTRSEELAKTDIKTHIRSRFQKQSDDGVAGGTAQFQKTDSNVRENNGL